MHISPDVTQAGWELGSAVFSVLNIRAVRRSRSILGVHWAPTAYFFAWGVYNLWFYTALHLPLAWWGGMAITATNLIWLGHVGFYWWQKRRQRRSIEAIVKAYMAEIESQPLEEIMRRYRERT